MGTSPLLGDLPGALPRRPLVTGADGVIGRAVVAALTDAGCLVTGLSPAWRQESPAHRLVTGDATDLDTLDEAATGCDAVVHLAALTTLEAGEPYEVYRINTDATFATLFTAGRHRIGRVAVAGSINASGVPAHRHGPLPAYYPIDHALPRHLDDWYSLSKASDELTAEMAASRWDLTAVVLRLPLVGVPHRIREHARRDDARQVREGWSYIDLRDAVRAFAHALTAPVSGALVVSVSAADTMRSEPTEELLQRYAPAVPRRRRFEGRETLIDLDRARTCLQFEPLHSARNDIDARQGPTDHDPSSEEIIR